jgi:ribosomal protein S28E/S33
MTEVELKTLHEIIKDKTTGWTTVREYIGPVAINDIRLFVKENERLPEAKEIMDQYLALPNFESILGIAEIKPEQIEKFIAAILKEADEEDFMTAEIA